MALSLARDNQIEVQFSKLVQHPCRRFFRFESSFSAFFLAVLQPCSAGTDTCLPAFALQPDSVKRIDIRTDANTHKAISCKYLSRSICTVVEESCQGYCGL